MTFYRWSQSAGGNGTADSTCPFPEGMAPSAVNDGVRGVMAALAKYRDDTAGGITTTGSATAYALVSYQQFDTLAHMSGQVVAFSPHVTNGAGPVTLNVDVLGAKPLRTAPGADLQAGVIVQGTPYAAIYNNTDGAWYLQGFFGNPYNIPLAAGLDYWGTAAPNSSFAFPFGQAISRTTYAALFALVGTTFGGGDGSTTFNLPDLRGRVTARLDNMGGTTANRLVTGALASMRHSVGGAGGEDAHILTMSELPSHTHTGTTGNDTPDHSHGYNVASVAANQLSGGSFPAATAISGTSTGGASTRHVHPFTTDASGGGGVHNNVQPTILCNYILRII